MAQPRKLAFGDVVFSEASDEQLITVWTLNAAAWAEPLSVEDHIKREQILSQQPATGDSWKTWVLTLEADKSEVVASVETFERAIIFGQGGACSTVKGYGIASVFTNPKFRGNRMANLLLEKLQTWLDGEGDGWISVLYSDIGADFYARLGWNPTSVKTLQVESDPRLCDPDHSALKPPMPNYSALEDEELLEALCAKDNMVLQATISDRSVDEKTSFSFAPKEELILWNNKREDLNGELIHNRWKTRYRGAISESGRAWILWHFDEIERKLKVQRIVTMDECEYTRNVQELAALLWFAQTVAKLSAFTTMIVWNPNEKVLAAIEVIRASYDQTKVQFGDRAGSIPCLRRRHGSSLNGLEWVSNEYYAWC